MRVTGRARAKARTGLEKSGREGSHSRKSRSRDSAAETHQPHQEPTFPPLNMLHGNPSVSPSNSQTQRWKGTGCVP